MFSPNSGGYRMKYGAHVRRPPVLYLLKPLTRRAHLDASHLYSPMLFQSYYIRTFILLAPALLLAGCWEKIEYTGSAPSSTSDHPVSSASAADATAIETKKIDAASAPAATSSTISTAPEDRSAIASSAPSPAADPPSPLPSTPPKREADVDRYATPPKAAD